MTAGKQFRAGDLIENSKNTAVTHSCNLLPYYYIYLISPHNLPQAFYSKVRTESTVTATLVCPTDP